VLFYLFFVLFYVFLCCSMYFCVVLYFDCFVPFSVLFVFRCVLNYCHQVATQLQLNISYHTIDSLLHRNKGHVNIGIIITLCLRITICSITRTNTTLKTPCMHLCSTTYFGRLCWPCFGRLWSAMMADTNGGNMW
jgi:hypothetical protein